MVGVSVDAESSLVDHYLVVEPAEDHQVLRIGLPTLRPGIHMVDLEAVATSAPVGLAHHSTLMDESSP